MSNEFGIGGVQAGLRRMAAFLPQLCGAFAAGLVAGAIEIGDNSTGAIVLGAYLVAGWYSARAARWRWLLPMAGLLAYGIMAVLGTGFSVVALIVLGESPSRSCHSRLPPSRRWAALVITGRVFTPATRIRIGVIGSPHAALRLRGRARPRALARLRGRRDDRPGRLGLRPRRARRSVPVLAVRDRRRDRRPRPRGARGHPRVRALRRWTGGSSPRSWPARSRSWSSTSSTSIASAPCRWPRSITPGSRASPAPTTSRSRGRSSAASTWLISVPAAIVLAPRGRRCWRSR